MIPFGYADSWAPTQAGTADLHLGDIPQGDIENGVGMPPQYGPVVQPPSIEDEGTIYRGVDWGDTPAALLMNKFEETNYEEDENVYNNYARGTIIDRRPDAVAFEHERPRGGVERQSGRLRLQYWGSRGDAEPANHSEAFLDFGGGDFRDPRAHNIDPDFKEYAKQEWARNRFFRFSKDDTPSITGGGRSEFRDMQDRERTFTWSRNLLKVFARQLDGKRNGMMRQYEFKTPVGRTESTESYGDVMRGFALNPARSPGILMKQILRDTAAYRSTTYDQDFDYARYSRICKGGRVGGCERKVATAKQTAPDMDDSDNSMRMKAAALLISQLIMTKRAAFSSPQDIEYGAQLEAQSGKTATIRGDVAAILHGVKTSMELGTSDDSTIYAQARLPKVKPRVGVGASDHLTPSHHILNAEIIYKGLKPKAGRVRKGDVIVDSRIDTIADIVRARKLMTTRGDIRKIETKNEHDTGDNKTVVNYKTKVGAAKTARNTEGHFAAAKSDESLTLRPATAKPMPGINRGMDVTAYGANLSKDRHGGRLGSKYTQREVSRETPTKQMEDF